MGDLLNVNFFEVGNKAHTRSIMMFLAMRLGRGAIFMIGPGAYRTTERVGEWAIAYGAFLEKGFV